MADPESAIVSRQFERHRRASAPLRPRERGLRGLAGARKGLLAIAHPWQ